MAVSSSLEFLIPDIFGFRSGRGILLKINPAVFLFFLVHWMLEQCFCLFKLKLVNLNISI